MQDSKRNIATARKFEVGVGYKLVTTTYEERIKTKIKKGLYQK